MNADQAQAYAAYLRGLDDVRDVAPVKLTVTWKRTTEVYFGVRYTLVRCYTDGMDACRRGERRPGEEYTSQWVSLLGKLPASYKPKVRMGDHWEQKIVYRFPGDDHDWYVAGYCQDIKPQYAEFHQFGPHWELSSWDSEPAIDHYDADKRDRLAVTLEAL